MAAVGLYGSSVLPPRVLVGKRFAEAVEYVTRAFVDSELAPDGWNQLQPVERDLRCVAALHDMRAEADLVYDA